MHKSEDNFELGYKSYLHEVPVTLPLKYFSDVSFLIPVTVQPWREKLQIFKRDSFTLGISYTGDGRDEKPDETKQQLRC